MFSGNAEIKRWSESAYVTWITQKFWGIIIFLQYLKIFSFSSSYLLTFTILLPYKFIFPNLTKQQNKSDS